MSQTFAQPEVEVEAKRASTKLALLLGLGGVDLAVLNVLIMPALLTATDLSPSRRAPRSGDRVVATTPAPTPPQPTAAVTVGKAVEIELAKTPAEIAPQPMAAAPVRVLFGTGNWWISPRGHRELADSFETFSRSQGAIEVIGHADRTGTRAFNQRLSEMRAQAVASLLASQGIDPIRLRVRGVGEDEPSPDGRDRRVEVRIGGAP